MQTPSVLNLSHNITVARNGLLGLFALLLLAACANNKANNLEPDERYLPQDRSSEGVLATQRAWVANVPEAGQLLYGFEPGIGEQAVCAAGQNGKVSCLDILSGRELWEAKISGSLSAGVGVGEGLIAVGNDDGVVTALRTAGGSVQWNRQLTGEILSAPQIIAGVIVVRTADGKLYGLSAADGSIAWTYEQAVPTLSLRGTAKPRLVGFGSDAQVLAGFDNGKIAALNVADGSVLWESTVARPSGRTEIERMVDVDGAVFVEANNVYASAMNGRTVSVALESGREIWEQEVASPKSLIADDDQVYVVDNRNRVYALSASTGSVVWRIDGLSEGRLTAPALQAGAVVLGDDSGNLFWLSADNGAILAKASAGGAVRAQPVLSDGRLFVLTINGKLSVWLPSILN